MSIQATREQHVERLTAEHGFARISWGFRSGVRDGIAGDHGGLCDPTSFGYERGYAAGQEVARLEGGAA